MEIFPWLARSVVISTKQPVPSAIDTRPLKTRPRADRRISRASHDQPHSLSVIGTLARGIPYRLVGAAGNCCCGAVHARGEGREVRLDAGAAVGVTPVFRGGH